MFIIPRSIIEPIRNLGFKQDDQFHLSNATDVDFDNQVIHVESALKPHSRYELQYDKLVIGVGALSNTFGTPGVLENAFFLKVRIHMFAYLLLSKWNIWSFIP